MTYTDSDITEKGEYRYDIFAIGTGGEGMKATSFVYLGEDSPASVASPLLEGVDAYTSTVISWEPVTTGLHNGNIDPASVRYTVYRRPDNKLVAENITETSVTDNSIRRTLSYYYDVVASNELGEAPETPTRSFILGPAFETPFVEEFDSDKETLNRWLLTDANGDYNTWMFNSTAGSTFFGDYETALEYLISPVSGGPYYDADEWLVSGPIKFESGKKYEIELAVRSVATEYLEIGIGSSEIPEDMYIVDCLEIEPSEITGDENSVRPTYYVTELRTEGIEIGSVGLHLCTPIDDIHYAFIQICSVTVRERDENGINTVTTPVLLTRFNNGSFEINGDFEKVEIFATSGAKMMESTTAITDLSSCPEGVYVAVITTKSERSTVKFVK